MPPSQRDPPPQATGLLSNVLDFISREVDSFVTNATGGPQEPQDEVYSIVSSLRIVVLIERDV
jgi:hypothetical protein